jgi:hypothetical protein
MKIDLTLLVATISLVVLTFYFCTTFWGKRTKPDLTETVSLILTTAGIISAIKLGYIAVFEGNNFQGILADQRIPILVGSVAILWVSINAKIVIFRKHLIKVSATEQGTGEEPA